MRISDWRSDVCASDLLFAPDHLAKAAQKYVVVLVRLDRGGQFLALIVGQVGIMHERPLQPAEGDALAISGIVGLAAHTDAGIRVGGGSSFTLRPPTDHAQRTPDYPRPQAVKCRSPLFWFLDT